jgi:predicted MFS family arabinose efflux permease
MTAPQTFPPDTVPYPPVATRLPWTGLLALAMAGFITILTEALPAGLMPQMSQGLGVSEALVGQLVTLYALGSLLAAIPLTLLTQGWRRRPLLMIAIGGFAVVNLVTALSTSYPLTLVARFCAGVFAGLVWALLAGYAARMVAPELKGRAIAVAMVGTPVALTIGIPAGTLLGTLAGWQASFVVMSVLTLALLVWVRIKVPDFPGQQATTRLSLKAVLQLPGVPAVLIATLGFVLAHNLLYTYIAPLLAPSGLDARIGMVLLLFGAAATLLQTACAKAGERGADVAQAMLVTTWNLGIAGGGLMGGVLLHSQGVSSLPWVAALLLLVVWATVLQARRAGFQSLRAAATGADR